MIRKALFILAFCLCLPTLLMALPSVATTEAEFIKSLNAVSETDPVNAARSDDDAGGATEGLQAAQCWDGSTVVCWGTTTSATNSACPSVQGQCYGSTSGTKYCPPCPIVWKSITVQCQDGTSRTCYGTGFVYGQNAVCFAGQNGYCWGNGSGTQSCPQCPALP